MTVSRRQVEEHCIEGDYAGQYDQGDGTLLALIPAPHVARKHEDGPKREQGGHPTRLAVVSRRSCDHREARAHERDGSTKSSFHLRLI